MLDEIAAVMAKRERLRVLRAELQDLQAERQTLRTRANLGLLGLRNARCAEEWERRLADHAAAKARLAVLATEIREHTARVRGLEGEIRRDEATLTKTVSKPGVNQRT